jgi:hypothetical protein
VDWTDLKIVGANALRLNPLGGLAAVSATSTTMEVFAFGMDGQLLWTHWQAGSDWSPLAPV